MKKILSMILVLALALGGVDTTNNSYKLERRVKAQLEKYPENISEEQKLLYKLIYRYISSGSLYYQYLVISS